AATPQFEIRKLLPVIALIGLLAIAFGPVLWDLFGIWESNPQYSHGYLVPVFAVGLLWLRRDSLRVERLRPSLWGLPLIAAGLLLRHVGGYVHIGWIEQFSLVACLPGIVVAIGGAEALRWSWPSLAFLLFMLPLPYRLEVALQGPLQRIGTVASTFVMQTVGLPAIATGNVIDVNGRRINVAEACSGLSMLTIFFALSTAVAMVSRRSLLERLTVVVSALPIAIIANVFRITLIGSLTFLGYDAGLVDAIHNWAALYMMPLALGLLWLECSFLSRLIVEEEVDPVRSPLASLAGISGYPTLDRKN
ncbi:MAG: exosortase/archaeosortase family protein, partial [Planctomycetota bacterium]|nr:exosortase/archaeosortase family protein [Planctomycetota bacterium]